MKNALGEDVRKRASFSELERALASLPVPQALLWALELTGRWSLPLQNVLLPAERHRENPRPAPPRVDGVVDLTALLTVSRPRDRKWTVGETWKGIGRHGEGTEEEVLQHETLDEEVTAVDGLDAFDGLLAQVESVDDEVVDREVEDPLLEDLHPHPSR